MSYLKTAALLGAFGVSACVPNSPYQKFKAGEAVRDFPYKAGATHAETDRAVTDCQVSAAQRVPPNSYMQATPTYTMSNGRTVGGYAYPVDANTELRVRVFRQCMGDKGFRYVNIPACPAGTTMGDLQVSAYLPPMSASVCYAVSPDNQGVIGTLKR